MLVLQCNIEFIKIKFTFCVLLKYRSHEQRFFSLVLSQKVQVKFAKDFVFQQSKLFVAEKCNNDFSV